MGVVSFKLFLRRMHHDQQKLFLSVFIILFAGWSIASNFIAAAEGAVFEGSFYSDVHKDVRIYTSVEGGGRFSKPRPENFFQSAGTKRGDICDAVLAALNLPGSSIGTNTADWLADGEARIRFSTLPGSKTLPEVLGGRQEMEYVSVDLDGDGASEHIYRRTGFFSGLLYQQIMISDQSLHSDVNVLDQYMESCKKWRSSNADCDGQANLISFLMGEPPSKRLASEWSFTVNNPISFFTGDKASKQLIFPGGQRLGIRNVGTSSGVSWELYKTISGVVVVSFPLAVFAPPEVLAFTPSRTGTGQLQCVFTPLTW